MAITAEEITALRNKERDGQSRFRNLWQETATYIFPRENQITERSAPGEEKMRKVYDNTAIRDSQDMASGLSAKMIPNGQRFFGIELKNRRLSKVNRISDYLARITESSHRYVENSNFMLQLNETLRSLVVFGTGSLYSEWDARRAVLNFKDFDISMYQILENNHGLVDTIFISFRLTARQAAQQFRVDALPRAIREAAAEVKTQNKLFDFIHYVGPREDRNPRLIDNLNMPFASMYVAEKEKAIIEEGGFNEFPFAVPRWMKSSSEIYGRGQGTEVLSDVKMLQQMMKDLIDLANRQCDPPRQVLNSFEGRLRSYPGAINRVASIPSIAGLDQQAMGNFPIAKDIIEQQQEKIHQAFFRDIFVQLAPLKGDRRTTVEITERIREGLRRLALPVARLYHELFDPLITRCVLLLMRNGRLPPPPPEIAGQEFEIEYQGPLSLALRDQQGVGFGEWAADVAQLEAAGYSGAMDNVNLDSGVRRLAEVRGVSIDDIASEDDVVAKRQARQQALAAQQALAMGGAVAEGYGKTNRAPEEGSPAGKIMEAVGA